MKTRSLLEMIESTFGQIMVVFTIFSIFFVSFRMVQHTFEEIRFEERRRVMRYLGNTARALMSADRIAPMGMYMVKRKMTKRKMKMDSCCR